MNSANSDRQHRWRAGTFHIRRRQVDHRGCCLKRRLSIAPPGAVEAAIAPRRRDALTERKR